MIYLQLCWSFLQVGLFSFGGGYASLPLIQNQVVDIHGWLSLAEFTDLITISQMTPGPIAINSATFVGMQIAGLGGAVVATMSSVLPSFVIASALGWLYGRYRQLNTIQGILSALRPAAIGMIASAWLSIFILAMWGPAGLTAEAPLPDLLAAGLFCAALFVLRKFKLPPVAVMLGCGAVGGVVYTLFL